MSRQITYLFGAGASAETIPVVTDFLEGLREIKRAIETEKLLDLSFETEKSKLVNDFLWLIDKCEDSASVDTYANKLFMRDDLLGLYKLKSLLNEFSI